MRPPRSAVLLVLALVGGPLPAAEGAPRTFRSELRLRVVAVVAPDADDRAPTDTVAGNTVAVGTTPSPERLEIPECLTWFVTPIDARLGPGDAERLAADVLARGVPGVSLRACAGADDDALRLLATNRSLRYLDLRETRVGPEGLAALRDHPALTWLDLTGTPTADLTCTRGMPQLEALDVSATFLLPGAFDHVAKAPRLRTLTAHAAAQIRDATIRALRGSRTLERLLLGSNDCITDAVCAPAAALPALRELELAHTSVTDAGLAELAAAPRLESLDLTGCAGVSSRACAALARAKRLRRLVLRGTAAADEGLADAAALPALRELDLGDTAVGDAGVTRLAGLVHLERLVLSDCSGVGDASEAALAGLSGLRLLRLDGTRVSDAARARLAQKLPRCDVR